MKFRKRSLLASASAAGFGNLAGEKPGADAAPGLSVFG